MTEMNAGDWRSVENAPETDGIYLVWMPGRSLDRYSCQWWNAREGGFSNDFGITHWMPLPPPPGSASQPTGTDQERAQHSDDPSAKDIDRLRDCGDNWRVYAKEVEADRDTLTRKLAEVEAERDK